MNYTHKFESFGNPSVSGYSCVKCGRSENHPIHKPDTSQVPLAVQRSNRWVRENEKEKTSE